MLEGSSWGGCEAVEIGVPDMLEIFGRGIYEATGDAGSKV